MSRLTIVANIFAKQDSIELVKSELMKLIDTTRAEEGCIDYDLHQNNENPAHFLFYENWQSGNYGNNTWGASIWRTTLQRLKAP